MRVLRISILCLICFLATGCGKQEQQVILPYDSEMLWHFKLGRDYVSQGRYELAKEYYLLALSANSDPEMEELIGRELHAVDLMIKTLR